MSTLIRHPRPSHTAGQLRGEKAAWDGKIERRKEPRIESGRSSDARPSPAASATGQPERTPGELVRPDTLPGRCSVAECDLPEHEGPHEDQDGFRWVQR